MVHSHMQIVTQDGSDQETIVYLWTSMAVQLMQIYI